MKKKHAYFRMSYIFGKDSETGIPSILFRIEKPYVNFFLEELFFLVSSLKRKNKIGKFHFVDSIKKGEKFLFGFNFFGFNHGEAWFTKKFLYLNMNLSPVGIKDISLTLISIFKSMEKVINKYSCHDEFPCLKLFEVDIVKADKSFGWTCFGKCPVHEIPEEKSQRLLLPAVISRDVLQGMSDSWRFLMDGCDNFPTLGANVYYSGDFIFTCPEQKAKNIIVDVGSDGKLYKVDFDVTKDVQQIVLYSALTKLSELVYKDIYQRIN